jgi:hypothetical protein
MGDEKLSRVKKHEFDGQLVCERRHAAGNKLLKNIEHGCILHASRLAYKYNKLSIIYKVVWYFLLRLYADGISGFQFV